MDEQKELQKNSNPSQPVTEVLPEIEIPTLRTYKSDISSTVNRDKITTAKILIAEQKREEATKEKTNETSIKRPTNIIALFFGVLFAAGALGLIGYFGYFGYVKITKQTFDSISTMPSFLFIFDEEKYIDSSKKTTDIYADVDKKIQEISEMQDGTFTDLVFFKKDTETKEDVRISSAEFFKIYEIKLPTNMLRSISQDFVYGVYKTGGKIEPFLVVGLVDYETAYNTMFLWESTLALDIRDLFPVLKDLFDFTKQGNILIPQELIPQDQNASSSIKTGTSTSVATTSTTTNVVQKTSTSTSSTNASSTSTTTPEQITPEEEFKIQTQARELINRYVVFTDVVFSNRDTRAARDSAGNPFFYYGFIDRNKILFAQDPKLIGEITRKIKEKSLVR